MRLPNSTSRGGSFSDSFIVAVWMKAWTVPGQDPSVIRQDACGALIEWSAYGDLGEFGWEIDHIRPVARGGGDELGNLQPLHWRNNRHKGDDWPNWMCAVAAR